MAIVCERRVEGCYCVSDILRDFAKMYTVMGWDSTKITVTVGQGDNYDYEVIVELSYPDYINR